jgi:DNA invertase Pin-like site-specific DNA recombinase
MNVVLYARVSSEQQAERDLSIKAQIKELEKFATSHEYSVVDIFIDEAKSARTDKRPAFQEMINLAKQKNSPFEAILVWKLSRFARNREDSILYKSMLKKKGIQVISISEQIDESAAGKLLEGILETVDEFYSNNLASDTLRGMKENASRGFYCGGTVPLGYRLKTVNIRGNAKKIFEVDDQYAPIVKKIFSLCLSGEGAKDIAKYLNQTYAKATPWSNTVVISILHNPVYIGSFLWNKKNADDVIVVNDCHEAIISKQDFLKAQQIISQRRPAVIHPRTLSCSNLLNGLVHCGTCGKLFTSSSAKSGKFFYYSCMTKLKSGSAACSQKVLNIKKFDTFILSVIRQKIFTKENISYLLKSVNKELGILKGEYI